MIKKICNKNSSTHENAADELCNYINKFNFIEPTIQYLEKDYKFDQITRILITAVAKQR